MATIDLGKIKLVWRGTYSGGTAYTVDDVVQHTDGGITSSFICTANSTGNAPSTGGSVHGSWAYLAKGHADTVSTTLTTQGDVLYRDGSGLQRLAKGTAGQALKMNTAANAPEWGTAGGLNKIVTARDSTVKTRSSGGTIDLVSLNITPSSTSSKILLLMQCAWGYSASANSPNASMFPKRAISGGATTTLSQEAATGSSPGGVAASEMLSSFGTEMIHTLSGHYVDQPNTTSQITYTLVYRVEDCGTNTMYVGSPGSTNTASWHTRVPHTITAIEVVV